MKASSESAMLDHVVRILSILGQKKEFRNYNADTLDVFKQCKQWHPNVLAYKGGQGRGGASNKFAFQTGFAEKINSPLQTHLIALFFCPDTYNDVKKMAHCKIPGKQSFYEQLDCLNSSTLTVHVVGNLWEKNLMIAVICHPQPKIHPILNVKW